MANRHFYIYVLYICPEHLTSNADGTQIVRSLMNYYVYHVAE